VASDFMDAAREMFFRYDGSRFYMSRDDCEATYASFEVPESTEREWIEELTALKIAALGAAGNWRVLNFLVNHRLEGHLNEVIAAKPLGKLWERTAFLEFLLSYVEVCRASAAHETIERGIDVVIAEGNRLLPVCRSDRSRSRVGAVIAAAERKR
jgi:hypothetical protein